nr:hypothetical protein GCM10020092_010950 [Actinoplanes digitatis]
MHEELVARGAQLEHQWVSVDGQAPLPHSAEPVALWSRRWYESLATSRYIVTNQHLPEWFERRPGQVVVQTWHGTPLKRIGFDIADVQFTDRRYLEKLEMEAPNWSFLVSPNTFSTPILRRAFKYDGELMEIGYPPQRPAVQGPGRDQGAGPQGGQHPRGPQARAVRAHLARRRVPG